MGTLKLNASAALADDLALALDLADAADRLSMRSFQRVGLRHSNKPDRSPVTEADLAVETMIREELARERPRDGVFGEEFGESGEASAAVHDSSHVELGLAYDQGDSRLQSHAAADRNDPSPQRHPAADPDRDLDGLDSGEAPDALGPRRWVVDPIDGTANFLRGVPVWATLIALCSGGRPILGVVSAPALGRRWWAASGQGAWTTGERTGDGGSTGPGRTLRVSAVERLADASLSFQSLAQWREAGMLGRLDALAAGVWRDRGYGDFWPYMMLAEGAVDIVAEFDVKEYDLAALVPVVTEAGGRFTSAGGEEGHTHGSALATNGLLHEVVLEVLRS